MARAKTSVKTLADLDAEIARLQAERDAVRAAEVKEVIARIKEAVVHYGLSAEDLGLGAKRRGRKPGKASAPAERAKGQGKLSARKAARKQPSVPKYGNGEGKTWSGHGKRPGWFVEALAAGKSAEDMLIKPSA